MIKDNINNFFIGNICLEYLIMNSVSSIPERISKKFLQKFNKISGMPLIKRTPTAYHTRQNFN